MRESEMRTLRYAKATGFWATSVKGLGIAILVIAALVLVVGVVSAVSAMSRSSSSVGTSVAASLGTVAVAAVVFVQGAFVLMVANYAKMRAEDTAFEVVRQMVDDAESA